jgi:hypothetical protein
MWAHKEDTRDNEPGALDLDAVCVTMSILDQLTLFGCMACLACRQIPIRDLPKFIGWLHVISDLIVVKVFAGNHNEVMEVFKATLVKYLRTDFVVTLINFFNNVTSFTSQSPSCPRLSTF